MDNPYLALGAPQGNPVNQSNPYAALGNIQNQTVTRETPPNNISPFMSAVTGFNTGVGRLAHGILQPITENFMGDRVKQGSQAHAAQREADFRAAENANPLQANIGEIVGNIAPTLFIPGLGTGGAALRLGKAAAAGAGIGAAQYVNPEQSRLTNTMFGTAGGLIGGGAGQLAEKVIQYGAKKYAQSAIPGLVERATDSLKKHITPERAMQVLQSRFNVASKANQSNWQNTYQLAKTLDSELAGRGKTFNGSRFIQDIDSGIQRLQNKEPAKRARYDNAIAFANYIKEQTPQSFEGAVILRQNLNQELKKYLEKNNLKTPDKYTKDTINNLKRILDKTVQDNRANLLPSSKSRFNKFEEYWKNANRSHAGLQEFVKTPTSQGVLKPRAPRREALENQKLDSAALREYIRPSNRGTEGIDQLRKLTGNNNAARSYVMRDVIEGRAKPDAALPIYEKLSIPQREALFAKTPYGEQLNAASYAKNTLGEPAKTNGRVITHHLGALGIPGLLGYAGAKAAGEDTEKSILYGLGTAGASKAVGAGIRNLIGKSSPAFVTKAVNRAQNPNERAGRYLSPILASMFSSGKGT